MTLMWAGIVGAVLCSWLMLRDRMYVESTSKALYPPNWPNKLRTPSELQIPAFLINMPFSYNTLVSNNVFMRNLTQKEKEPNMTEAFEGAYRLYKELVKGSLVYILPCDLQNELQDIAYTANVGIVLSHLSNLVVISNFTSEPRRGETPVVVAFFQSLGYQVHVSPHRFEGEADLKHLYENVYVGGYGIRSEIETYQWMEATFNMTIIKLHMTSEEAYHLDCSIFPLTRRKTLVAVQYYTVEELEALSRHTEVIKVPATLGPLGLTNMVRLGNNILSASRRDLTEGQYDELGKFLSDLCSENGLGLVSIDLEEFMKSGALLSCMVLHLNRVSYNENELGAPIIA